MTVVQCYVPTETFNMVERDAFYEEINAVQGEVS